MELPMEEIERIVGRLYLENQLLRAANASFASAQIQPTDPTTATADA